MLKHTIYPYKKRLKLKKFCGHAKIDRRTLTISRLVARQIENDPNKQGLKKP